MFSRVRASWSVVFIVVTVALSALPVAAQPASTTVTISVPPVQQVEGPTSLVVHQVEYEVQLDGRTAQPGLPITITFSVEPAAAH